MRGQKRDQKARILSLGEHQVLPVVHGGVVIGLQQRASLGRENEHEKQAGKKMTLDDGNSIIFIILFTKVLGWIWLVRLCCFRCVFSSSPLKKGVVLEWINVISSAPFALFCRYYNDVSFFLELAGSSTSRCSCSAGGKGFSFKHVQTAIFLPESEPCCKSFV